MQSAAEGTVFYTLDASVHVSALNPCCADNPARRTAGRPESSLSTVFDRGLGNGWERISGWGQWPAFADSFSIR